MVNLEKKLQNLQQRVRPLYETPPRAYHNWGHIEACLGELARARDLCSDPVAVELAIWFHDCVYDVYRHDNEERSAGIAELWLAERAVTPATISVVSRLIQATRHDAPPSWRDGMFMVDIDLAILGQDTSQFDAYESAIREEYSSVPDNAFREGRAGILKLFLERPRIYLTDFFCLKYEAAARANLTRSIARLAAGH